MRLQWKTPSRIPGFLIAIVLFAGLFAFPSKTTASFAASGSNDIVVSLSPGVTIEQINTRYGTSTREEMEEDADYQLSLPAGANQNKILKQMAKDPNLVFAEPLRTISFAEIRQRSHAFIDPSGGVMTTSGQGPTKFYQQPFVTSLNLAGAHQYTRGGGITIAVIDTGIDFSHPILQGRIVGYGKDYVDGDGHPNDEPGGDGSGHGTFVAGLIALTAPDALILPVRAFDVDGSGTSFGIAKAIRYAATQGALVINMSFGLADKDQVIKKAINFANTKAYMVGSAGNDNIAGCEFPAGEKGKVLSVTATTPEDLKASFANFDKKMDVSAPGVSLYSAYPGGRWSTWSGTSFSTALVSGEAALLLSLKSSLNSMQVDSLITSTGTDLNSLNKQYKNSLGKRIDYRNAVLKLVSGQ